MNTLSAAELAHRVTANGGRLSPSDAAGYLRDWLETGVVEEALFPGRYRLTDYGRSLAAWVAPVNEERKAA